MFTSKNSGYENFDAIRIQAHGGGTCEESLRESAGEAKYKGEFQHCFWSKCYGYILLNLSPNKNLELIPFILIPELVK